MNNTTTYDDLLKRVENLEKERDFYKKMIDSTYDWEVFRNPEGKIIYINDAFEKITGFSKHDIMEGRISEKDVVHPEDFSYVFDAIKQSIAGYAVNDLEFRIITKSGETKYISLFALPIKENGKFTGIRTSARDITDMRSFKKLAELTQEVSDANERFKTYIENSPTSVFLVNEQGRYQYVNPSACNLLGYEEEELLKMSIPDIVPKELLQEALGSFTELQFKGYINNFEIKHLCKDGSLKDVVLDGVKLSDTEYIAYVKDITHIKQFEQKLQTQNEEYAALNEEYLTSNEGLKSILAKLEESESRFKILHNASFGGITIHDKGLILDCNLGLSEITGYTYDELIGMNGLLLIAESSREFVMSQILSEYEKPYEAEGIRKNGEIYPVRLEARMIQHKGKRVRVVEFRDISEQKNAEIELLHAKFQAEESELKFRLMYENTSVGIAMATLDFEITNANKAFCDILGYSEEELRGKALEDYTHYTEDDENLVLLKNLITGEINSCQFEKQFIHKDGHTVFGLISANILKDINGAPKFFLGNVQDITSRKMAELELERNQELLMQSETKYRAIFENVQDVIYQVDMDGTIVEISPSVEKYGYHRKDWIGKNVLDIYYYAEDRKKLLEALSKYGKISDYEVALKASDGGIIDVSLSSHIIINSEGIPIGIEGSLRDISERKKTEKQLRANEERYRALVDNAFEGIMIASLQGEILFVNKAFLKMIEADSESEIIGRNVFEFIAPESQEKALKDFQNVASGLDSYIAEYSGYTAKRNKIWFESIGKLIRYEDGVADLISVRNITERKKAREELIAAKEEAERMGVQLLNAMKIARMGAWELDIERGIFTFTDQLFSIFKTSAEEMNGYEISIEDYGRLFVHPDDAHLLEEETKLALETNDPGFNRYIEHRVFFADRSPGYIAVRYFIVKDENGKTIKTFGVNQDITERKLLEIELLEAKEKAEENEEKYKSIFDQSLVSILVADDKGNYLSANKSASQLFGYTIDELTRMNVSDLTTNTKPNAVESYLKYIEIGEETGEFEFITKKGENKIAQYLAVRIKPNFNLSMLIDITERKLLEIDLLVAKEKAEEGEANVTAIIEGTEKSIWAFNRNYEILYVNNAFQTDFEQSFGVRLKKGTNLVNSLPEYLRPIWKSRYDRVLANEQFMLEDAVETQHGTIYVQVSFNPIVKNGQVIGGSCIGSNVTAIKQAEKELIAAKEKAEESDRLKTAFLANMSHEIRTPMNGILGFMNLLAEPNLSDDEKNEYIEIVNASGQRLLDTINDIIEVSNIESGQMQLVTSAVDVNDLLCIYLDFFDLQAQEKGIEIVLSKKINSKQSLINTDKHKLDGILTNLIKNAIKFTNNGTIEIGCELKHNELEFFVKDTGMGIAADRIDAIFERFVQADLQISRPHEGSGLGLAIVKAYLDIMGGKVWVESELKKGSTFYFTIPFLPVNDETTINSNTENELVLQTNKLKILVAEDDNASYQYLEILLAKEGFDLVRTKTGEETLEVLKNDDTFSILLLDIKMPGMNGYDAAIEIRKFNKNIPIFAQTAYALAGDKEKALAAGCNEYLTKPINKNALLKYIEKYAFGI